MTDLGLACVSDPRVCERRGDYDRRFCSRPPIDGLRMPDVDPSEFVTRTADLDTGVRLAYVREGQGRPLLLVHGFPQTKRIWWRNIGILASTGFDVIAVDLRGYGESSLAPDGYYDPAAFGRDLHSLLMNELGIESCVAAGGDLGGVVLIDMSLRYPGLIERLCLFNTTAPELPDRYEAAGIASERPGQHAIWDYAIRQGNDPGGLLDELASDAQRRGYIATFYGHRLWGTPEAFTPEQIDFHTEPFADQDRLRAAFTDYEVVVGKKQPSEPERLSEPVEVPTLVLFGPDDAVQDPTFPDKAALAFTTCIGPFIVRNAGHYLPWEQPHIFNQAVIGSCATVPRSTTRRTLVLQPPVPVGRPTPSGSAADHRAAGGRYPTWSR